MIINSFPSNNANAVAPYSPLGRQPVSQETSDLKLSSIKALEQLAAPARNKQAPNEQEQQAVSVKSERSKQERQPDQQKQQLAKDQSEIKQLAAIDREVRAHEQAHAAVGGQYAGSPTYEFVKGPDGVNYAVGGEVSISSGPVPNDPEATIPKAQQVRAAANAPADPSGQDRSVAAAAANLENEARAELSAQKNAEVQEKERIAEENVKAQKAEESAKNEREKEYRDEEKKARYLQEEKAARRSAELADSYTESNQKALSLNRHLVEIGATKGLPIAGNFLNLRV